MDNDKPFSNKLMDKICDLFGFKQCNSLMYYVASNELAKAFNKILCYLLKGVISKSKRDWHDIMDEALWTYRMTYRILTQETPYSPIYGTEVVLPLEHQIPSLQLAIQEGLTEEENAHLRHKQLKDYMRKVWKLSKALNVIKIVFPRAFNEKVHLRSFQAGDQVLVVIKTISYLIN